MRLICLSFPKTSARMFILACTTGRRRLWSPSGRAVSQPPAWRVLARREVPDRYGPGFPGLCISRAPSSRPCGRVRPGPLQSKWSGHPVPRPPCFRALVRHFCMIRRLPPLALWSVPPASRTRRHGSSSCPAAYSRSALRCHHLRAIPHGIRHRQRVGLDAHRFGVPPRSLLLVQRSSNKGDISAEDLPDRELKTDPLELCPSRWGLLRVARLRTGDAAHFPVRGLESGQG